MTTQPAQEYSQVYRYLLLILAFAFIIRVLAALYLGNTVSGPSGAHDEISYSMLANRFVNGHGMTFPERWYPWIDADAPQSYYSYSMSLYLAGIYALFGYQPLVARLVTAVLSTLLILMVFLLARRLFDDHIALLASAIAAVYAYLVFYGVTLVTETPFMLAMTTALYITLRIVERPSTALWVCLGIALAVAVLLRMAVVFFVPFLFLWLLLAMGQRRQLAMLAVPVVLITLAVLPFTIRNYMLWDRFMLLEAQFGHVFWNGNHPDHAGDFHPFEVFPIPLELLRSQNDAEITTQLLHQGIQNVLNDPGHFAQLTLTRLREFFKFWPTSDTTLEANILRVISFGAIVPLAVIGLVMNLSRWRMLAPIYLFIFIHTGVYALSWSMIRYRVPLDVFFIMFAASAVHAGYVALLNHRRTGKWLPEIFRKASFGQARRALPSRSGKLSTDG